MKCSNALITTIRNGFVLLFSQKGSLVEGAHQPQMSLNIVAWCPALSENNRSGVPVAAEDNS